MLKNKTGCGLSPLAAPMLGMWTATALPMTAEPVACRSAAVRYRTGSAIAETTALLAADANWTAHGRIHPKYFARSQGRLDPAGLQRHRVGLLQGEGREIPIMAPGNAAVLQGTSVRLHGWNAEPVVLAVSGQRHDLMN